MRVSLSASLVALLASWIALSTGCASSPPPRLLLLITIDTLRADHLGVYGDPRGLTPNIDALAERSVRFTASFAPASYTLPSMAALLCAPRRPEWFDE